MNPINQPKDIRNFVETVLVLMLFLALLLALFDVLKVFFGVLTFALIFSVSFSGPFEKLVILVSGKRRVAAIIYAILLILILTIPFIFFISSLTRHVKSMIEFVEHLKRDGMPLLPPWVIEMPLIGEEVASFWSTLQESPKETLISHEHQIKEGLHHIIRSGMGVIGAVLQFVLGIIVSSLVLASGNKLLTHVRLTMQHLFGERDGLVLLDTIAQAIRGVSIGVMGTAFIAAVVAWIGLSIAGVPFAIGLSAIVFFLVMLQVGPLLVWIPVVIWMATQGNAGMVIFLVIYGIILLLLDAVLKPIFIAKSGGGQPFLVLFIGVIGGMAAWGFTGMFKGAIILAVFYTIFISWLDRKRANSGYSDSFPLET